MKGDEIHETRISKGTKIRQSTESEVSAEPSQVPPRVRIYAANSASDAKEELDGTAKKMRTFASFAKDLRILDAIIPAQRGRTLTEIANDMCANPSDIFLPYLNTLLEMGWIFKDRTDGIKYFLARRKKEDFINSTNRLNILITNASWEGIERLHKKYDENIIIAVRRYGRIVFIAEIPSSKDRTTYNVFPDHSLQFTAAGRAILAYEPDDVIQKYLYEAPYEMYSTRSISNIKDLENALKITKQTGVAINDKESGDSICAVAVPIFRDGAVVASLVAQLVTKDYTTEERDAFIDDIRDESEKISHRLSFASGK